MIKKDSLLFVCFLIFSSNIFAQFNIGHTTNVFFDDTRNRNIETEIYYPADTAGDNVPLANENFPVILLGHGFVMTLQSYQSYWETLVPLGYIICFPTTEGSLSPSHEDFGLDLKFLAHQMQLENNETNSLFFNSIASQTALMGHSMGGGSATLGAENISNINSLITFAAAETNPSAIAAATNISVPTLLFSGDVDCVTPPGEHQNPMYENLASECKTLISIKKGGHFFFADESFTCNIGELSCNPSLDISRDEQQTIVFNFLKLWLDYTLNDNQNAFTIFNDSLENSSQIDYVQSCNTTVTKDVGLNEELIIYPNPVENILNIEIPKNGNEGTLIIYNLIGKIVYQDILASDNVQVNLNEIPDGRYFVQFSNKNIFSMNSFIKVNKS